MATSDGCEILGAGLPIKDLAERKIENAVFEVKEVEPYDLDKASDRLKYEDDVRQHLNFLALGEQDNEGNEPFEKLSEKMMNLIPSGKIKKMTFRGGYGEKPSDTSTVKIHYNAYVQFEAAPFDSTYGREAFTFTLGQETVIRGLEIAVRSMKINEKSQFLIEPEYAYKSSGLGRIPPDSTVLFVIEMLDCKATQPIETETKSKDFKSVLKLAQALCYKAKSAFRQQDYDSAIIAYVDAVRKIENSVLDDYDDQLKCDEMLLKLYTNLLVCYTLVEKPKLGCFYANQTYALVKNGTVKLSSKVYFNNAKCLKMLGDFTLAEKRFRKALEMEPKNTEIVDELKKLQAARAAYHKQRCQFAKGFVGS